MRLVHPMMKQRGWGRLVNTIGGAGKEPQPLLPARLVHHRYFGQHRRRQAEEPVVNIEG
jgi:hypothetical protein